MSAGSVRSEAPAGSLSLLPRGDDGDPNFLEIPVATGETFPDALLDGLQYGPEDAGLHEQTAVFGGEDRGSALEELEESPVGSDLALLWRGKLPNETSWRDMAMLGEQEASEVGVPGGCFHRAPAPGPIASRASACVGRWSRNRRPLRCFRRQSPWRVWSC